MNKAALIQEQYDQERILIPELSEPSQQPRTTASIDDPIRRYRRNTFNTFNTTKTATPLKSMVNKAATEAKNQIIKLLPIGFYLIFPQQLREL